MDIGSKINQLDLPPPVQVAGAAPMVASAKIAASGAPAVAEAKASARLPSQQEIQKSVDAINQFLQPNSEVHFSIDEASGRSVVKVIDTETQKVLRQFPSEQSLEIGKNLTSLKGLLINNKA